MPSSHLMNASNPDSFTFYRGNDSIAFIDAAYDLFCSHRFLPWSKEIFTKSFQNHFSFVICSRTRVVGYIIVSHVLDEAEIEDICVVSNYRQRGIANQLLEHLIQNLQSEHCTDNCTENSTDNSTENSKENSTPIKAIFLEVAKTNKHAIRLYEKNAFEVCGLRKNYYEIADDKVDAILMKRAINSL